MGPAKEPLPSTVSLGRRLKTLRKMAGVTWQEVEAKGCGSRQTLIRRERGQPPYNPNIVRSMCELYGASRDETNELVAIAFRIKDERIIEDNTDLIPPVFGMYVDFESRASRILTYQPDVLPGLLQTPDYARAVYRAYRPRLSEEVCERYVDIRLDRQRAVLEGVRSARIEAVLSEAVLARQVGGLQVATAQIKHLRHLCNTRNVNVRVLTFRSGAHAAMRGSFTLLRGDGAEDPDVVYVESAAAAQLLYKLGQLADFQESFDALTEQSIPIGEFAA